MRDNYDLIEEGREGKGKGLLKFIVFEERDRERNPTGSTSLLFTSI